MDELTVNQKAVKQLQGQDISAKEEHGTVYVFVGDTTLELAEFEIKYQAGMYDIHTGE